MRKRLFPLVVGALLLSASAAFAEEPVVNVSQKLHPNLAEAQKLSRIAFNKILDAQRRNGDMEGHAQRAKELLNQVNIELKLAAEAANRARR